MGKKVYDTKNDEDYELEFYREEFARMQQEKDEYVREGALLREQLRAMSEAHRKETAELLQSIESMRQTILDQSNTIQDLSNNLRELMDSNKAFTGQLANAASSGKRSRGKRNG